MCVEQLRILPTLFTVGGSMRCPMNASAVRASLAVVVLAVGVWQTATPVYAVKYWKNGVANGNWNSGNNWSASSAAGGDNGGTPFAGEPTRIVHTDGTARTITLNTVTPAVGLVVVDLTGPGTASDSLLVDA